VMGVARGRSCLLVLLASGAGALHAPLYRPARRAHPVAIERALEQLVAQWPTFVPQDASSSKCVCGSGGTYAECCKPFHDGALKPESATRVLQTRYSAFAYRLPLHLMRTTHWSNPEYSDDLVEWAQRQNRNMFDQYNFLRIEPGAEEAGSTPDEAFITFRVVLAHIETMAELAFTERSRFVRDGEEWFYAGGEMLQE